MLPSCDEEAVTMERLGEWARGYNARHAHKIRMRGRVLRMAIADVMTVYMGIGTGDGNRVVVETIRAFGPREKVGTGYLPQTDAETAQGAGHGESRYTVYQQVSQQLHRVLEAEGLERVQLQTVARLVAGYADLFLARCAVCERVVSGEVPAVVRRWTGAGWRAEHIGCAI